MMKDFTGFLRSDFHPKYPFFKKNFQISAIGFPQKFV